MTVEAGVAPLLSTPQAPVPPAGGAAWLQVRDGARLRVAFFPAQGRSRGSVVLNQGRTESIEKFFEIIVELQARGFHVLTHDWRGQGLSTRFSPDPNRGHARGWRLFLRDFQAVLGAYEARLPRPWIAVGHSMGGALTLLALTEGENRFSAVLLLAPMLGLRGVGRRERQARMVAWFRTFVGQGAQLIRLRPLDFLHHSFEDNVLGRDYTRWARWRSLLQTWPALRVGGVTWGWLAFALSVIYRLKRLPGLETIKVPVTIIMAGDDRLCVNAAAHAAAARISNGKALEAPGALQDLLMDVDAGRAVFWREFDDLVAKVV